MRVIPKSLVGLMAITLLSGCGGGTSEPETTRDQGDATVCVVNYPLQYFAQRIGGEHIEVAFPCPPEKDPAHWRPTPEQIQQYQGASLILLNGAGYAAWTQTASLPTSRTYDTSAAFADRLIEIEGELLHSHGPVGKHSHAGVAFTTWLDPTLAIEQAEAVRDAMIKAWPQQTSEFETRCAALRADLAALDADLERMLADHAKTPFIASHPVYQYFTRRYGLNVRSVHFEPHEAPSDEAWRAFESLLAEHSAGVMIWEREPLESTRAKLETLGVRCVVFDPCGNAPATGDYLSVMNANATRLAGALQAAR